MELLSFGHKVATLTEYLLGILPPGWEGAFGAAWQWGQRPAEAVAGERRPRAPHGTARGQQDRQVLNFVKFATAVFLHMTLGMQVGYKDYKTLNWALHVVYPQIST